MKHIHGRSMAFAAIQILSSMSFAALDINKITGQKTAYKSTFGKQELCVISDKMKPADYKDKDARDEQQLCGYDFYTNVGLCSKLNSTNPGTLIVELLAGKSRQDTMKMCSSKDGLSVEAKFKNSISCSYAPSILAYYHFSRMLKAGNVPVAVLRTMDKAEHLKVTKEALRILSSKTGDVIYKTWSSFLKEHESASNQNIFDTTGQFVYGALSDNPKGEMRYTEVSGVGSYDTRYERFLQQPPYKKVSSSSRVSDLAGSDQYKKIAPVVVQMKDVSDMILLDTLFSQDDRIGNIHYKLSWMVEKTDTQGKKSFDFEKSKAKLAADKKTWVIPENEKAIQNSGAVLVKEILLKDNDCGVNIDKRSNMMRKISALEGVKHMSGRTYKRFIEMYKMAQTPEFKNWMRMSLLFREADLGSNPGTRSGKSFYANLEKAYSILTANCKSGALKLDLNVDDYIPGNAPQNYSCE